MEPVWRVRLLGTFRAERQGEEVTRFSTQQTASLFAYLALYPRLHSREEVAYQIWPEVVDGKKLRGNLSVALTALRKRLEPPSVTPGSVIEANRISVRLRAGSVTSDVTEFSATIKAAKQASAEKAPAIWEAAARLYTGELLPGFYDEWVQQARRRLEADVLAMHEALAEGANPLLGEVALDHGTQPFLPVDASVGDTPGESPVPVLGLPHEFTRFFGREAEKERLLVPRPLNSVGNFWAFGLR